MGLNASHAKSDTPLGFGSPMLGFDLHLFVDAVQGAIDENGPITQDAGCDDGISFEVCEAPKLRSSSVKLSMRPTEELMLADAVEGGEAHAHGERRATSKLQFSAATAAAPPCLLVLSSLLTGFAALSIGASLTQAVAAISRIR